jgi:uncharacterized protein YbjT (DUF2867 family)
MRSRRSISSAPPATTCWRRKPRPAFKHHIALSGSWEPSACRTAGYFRGKQAQEDLIRDSGIPYTTVHSTQFFEFTGAIAQSGAKDQAVHVSSALFQPDRRG